VFDKYDVNKDGVITAEDLKKAFAVQNKKCSDEEIRQWIEERDRSQRGSVSFADFLEHYR
jgi:Ca2+-binding EF-hand superfamily protein